MTKTGVLRVELGNRRCAAGRGARDALLDASALRPRTMRVTSGATIAGRTPVAPSRDGGAEARVPAAVAAIDGLLTSSVLTLGVAPALHSLLDTLRVRIMGRRANAAGAAPAEAANPLARDDLTAA